LTGNFSSAYRRRTSSDEIPVGVMMTFQPIHHERPIAVRIAFRILERIKAGTFPVGAKLPGEVELSRQFGVSRPTIREALGALQFAGYVDSVRGSGTRVVGSEPAMTPSVARDLTAVEILHLLEARLVIEPQVAALAAGDPDLKALAAAQKIVHGMDLVASEPSIRALTDLRVHSAIAQVCRNSFMTDAALRLLDRAAAPVLSAARNRAWSDDDLPHVWAGHHAAVLDAIRERKPEAAAECAWHHLSSAATNVIVALGDVVPTERSAIAHLEAFIAAGPAIATVGTRRRPPLTDASRQRKASQPRPLGSRTGGNS
jgi:DNA-binding FadR family transcriptional regulator